MDPVKDYADSVVAEAIAAGKPKEEAEALRPAAEEEGKRIVGHPLFKKFEGHARKRFSEHDDLKKEVAPLKTAAQRLQEIENKGKTDQERLASELEALKPKATRADALEAEVQAIFDEATTGLTDEQKAVIVGETPEARLKHFRALKAAGLIGGTNTPDSKGTHRPGAGSGGSTITQSEFVSANETRRKALRQAVAEGKLSVVPG